MNDRVSLDNPVNSFNKDRKETQQNSEAKSSHEDARAKRNIPEAQPVSFKACVTYANEGRDDSAHRPRGDLH